MKTLPPFLEILATRVRRNYTGGALLDRWSGNASPTDGDQPEDWIASTVPAVNPGLPAVSQEGLTLVRAPGAEIQTLPTALAAEPDYYLGSTHRESRGLELGFLAKLLDSSMRLHVQAHPTATFAQRYLGSRYGKLETYVILSLREGITPTLRLGFQHAPSREEWKRIILEQDIPAMDACFTPIPLAVGEIWKVPGGMPHAIGEGVLMLEVMEPSDLVVRCEFERAGIVVPPQGRFMGRDLDFCLDIFDYRSYSTAEIQQQCRLTPLVLESTPASTLEQLVGPKDTSCFGIQRLRLHTTQILPRSGSITLALVTQGEGFLTYDGAQIPLRQATRFLLPAHGPAIFCTPAPGTTLEIILCRP